MTEKQIEDYDCIKKPKENLILFGEVHTHPTSRDVCERALNKFKPGTIGLELPKEMDPSGGGMLASVNYAERNNLPAVGVDTEILDQFLEERNDKLEILTVANRFDKVFDDDGDIPIEKYSKLTRRAVLEECGERAYSFIYTDRENEIAKNILDLYYNEDYENPIFVVIGYVHLIQLSKKIRNYG